jgi:hypothetical protein
MKAISCLLASLLAANAAAAETRPIVVELFTSQSCSSCPPADALLGELARRQDVVALGFHISYWNDLGWKDPLSSPRWTDRQRAYAGWLGTGQVYTPQLVLDGVRDIVGSDRATVLGALAKARPRAIAPTAFAADRRSVTIGPAATPGAAGTVLLVRFAERRTTHVDAGENARRTLEDSNGVESLETLGSWDGTEAKFAVEPPAAGSGVAVLVQAADGRMLGAAAIAGL